MTGQSPQSTRPRTSVGFVLLALSLLIFASAASAHAQAKLTVIRNNRDYITKICIYRGSGKAWLYPIRCWTLNEGDSVTWNRGNKIFDVDVRVFRAGLVDVPVCERRRLGDVSELAIQPPGVFDANRCIESWPRIPPRRLNTVPVKEWKVGDKVLVQKPDALWYMGTIFRKSPSMYEVLCADGTHVHARPDFIASDYVDYGTRVMGGAIVIERNGDQIRLEHLLNGNRSVTNVAGIVIEFEFLPKPPKENTLLVCNRSSPRKVYFSLAYATSEINSVSEGWWNVGSGRCLHIDLAERWRTHRLSVSNAPKTYIYGETAASAAGVIYKVWEGKNPNAASCADIDKWDGGREVPSQFFVSNRTEAGDGVLWESSCKPNQKSVKMIEIKSPATGEQMRWSF